MGFLKLIYWPILIYLTILLYYKESSSHPLKVHLSKYYISNKWFTIFKLIRISLGTQNPNNLWFKGSIRGIKQGKFRSFDHKHTFLVAQNPTKMRCSNTVLCLLKKIFIKVRYFFSTAQVFSNIKSVWNLSSPSSKNWWFQ